MKKYILSVGIIMVMFAFIAAPPLKATAAESAIDVAVGEEGTASVKLILPNARQEGITTVSISLAVDLEDMTVSAEEIRPEVDFTEWVNDNTKVHAYRSDHGGVLNIYIAGMEPLFAADEGGDGDVLDVGTVYMKRADGSLAPFGINIEKSELRVVRGVTTVLITEDDLKEADKAPEEPEPGQEPNPDPGPGQPSGGTEEIDTIRAKLQELIERAEAIPAQNRTEELQRAIDEAKRVLSDPNASLEELQEALINLENALALFESNQNSENNSSDTGRDVNTQNRKQNGARVQSVKTGDTDQVLPYIAVMLLCMVILVRRTGIHR